MGAIRAKCLRTVAQRGIWAPSALSRRPIAQGREIGTRSWVRFSPVSGHFSTRRAGPLSANNGLMHRSKRRARAAILFDHLVGTGNQRRRDSEAERPGSLEIDYKFELGRLR